MKTNSNPEPDDGLLDALLRDDEWQSANAAFKAEALGAFRARQRVRRVTRWASGLATSLAVLAATWHWFRRPVVSPRPDAVAQLPLPKAPDKPRYLTDKELLAAFPKGSCFIAEVDGKKELVFLDPALQRVYISSR